MSNERAGDADDVADKLRAEALALIEWAGADSWTGEVVRDLLAAQPAAAPDPEAVKRARIETAALLGWSTFGTHVDHPEVALEFAGDDGGVPEFERAVPDPEAPLRAKVEALAERWAEVLTECKEVDPRWLLDRSVTTLETALRELRAVLGDSGALAEHEAKALRDALLKASSEWASEYDRLTREQPREKKSRAAYRMASVLAEQRANARTADTGTLP